MTHLQEGTLVQFLDGEVAAEERIALLAHLEDCIACARARNEIEEQSRALAELLERTDSAPRVFALERSHVASKRHRPMLRAAAAVVLLLGAASLLTTPVRAWIHERWDNIRRAIGAAPHEAREHTAPATASAPTRVGFMPVADTLVLRVASRQATGELLLVATETPGVVVEVSEPGNDVELVVLPGELRIANAARARASYRIALPSSLTRVVIAIGSEPSAIITPPRRGERRTITLSIPMRTP